MNNYKIEKGVPIPGNDNYKKDEFEGLISILKKMKPKDAVKTHEGLNYKASLSKTQKIRRYINQAGLNIADYTIRLSDTNLYIWKK